MKRGGGVGIGGKIGLFFGSPITGGIFGSAIGAVVGGSYGSWLASPNRRILSKASDFQLIERSCKMLINNDMSVNENAFIIENSRANRKLNIDQELILKSKLDDRSLNIGKIHNVILASMDGSVILKNETQVQPNLSNIKEALFNSTELINNCKVVGSNASIGLFCNSDIMLSKVMELFNEVLEKYASKKDDVAFITGKYIDIIEKTTELTTEQKTCIKSGLATALYSCEYWESTFEESIK